MVKLKQVVEDLNLEEGMKVDELVKQLYKSGGFTAKKLAVGVDILENMLKDKGCIKFLSFPACIVATGTRGVIRELVRRKYFDVIITTSGTLDHDLARIWGDYYHGSFMLDDKKLHKEGINRLGNILIPNECYGEILEKKMQPILNEIFKKKKEWSTKEIIWEFGKKLEKEKRGKDSIIYWTWKNRIPIFVPGITDGAFGSQLWMFYQQHRDFKIDLLRDEQDLSDIVFTAKRTGALIIGGGISKHHTIWWNQFKNGLDYAVYITTAAEYDGSLSGARTREAVSWGKINEKAKYVTIEGDATVILPIITNSLLNRI
jgi:deoxyhypusine synthase